MRTWSCARPTRRRFPSASTCGPSSCAHRISDGSHAHACGGCPSGGKTSPPTPTPDTPFSGRNTPDGRDFASTPRARRWATWTWTLVGATQDAFCSTTPAADENGRPALKGARGKTPEDAHHRWLADSRQFAPWHYHREAMMMTDQAGRLCVPPPKT